MWLAKVLGQVVATAKEPGLDGFKLLYVRNALESSPEEAVGGEAYVAVDLVGAGDGDIVLVTTGSAARLAETVRQAPTDCAVVAIADTVVWQGSVTYNK